MASQLARYVPESAIRHVIDPLVRVFSIDLRALAMFRIGLGLLILANLAILATDLRFFFTDDGIMPRRVWAQVTDTLHWSLHAASGALWFQVFWFSVSAVAAFLLLIGYRTRLMSVLCWALLVSLINRNHFILQAGDQLLVILAFWSMFMPLNARYSVDAALQAKYANDPHAGSDPQAKPDNRYFSIATVALVLQVLYLYFFTALLKTGVAWRVNFDAAFYAVSLEHFATPIGAALRDFEGFLKFGTGYVLLVEFIAPLLVLCPWFFLRVRLFAVACLYSLHVGFLLMLHIGLFPLIDFVALLVLLPGPVWDFLSKASFRRDRQPLNLLVNRQCSFCYKASLLLREFFLPANSHIELSDTNWSVTTYNKQSLTGVTALIHIIKCNRWFRPLGWLLSLPPLKWLLEKLYQYLERRREEKLATAETPVPLSDRLLPWRNIRLKPHLVTQLLAAFFLYAVTYTNIASVKTLHVRAPDHVRDAIKSMRLDQRWGMFAPKPLVYSVHPVITGKLRNGQLVDVYNNTETEPNWQPPAYGYAAYPGYRTRKLYERVDGNVPGVSAAYGDYLCRKWNYPQRKREKQLGLIEIFSVRRRTNTEGLPKAETRHSLWRHWCYPEFEPKG